MAAALADSLLTASRGSRRWDPARCHTVRVRVKKRISRVSQAAHDRRAGPKARVQMPASRARRCLRRLTLIGAFCVWVGVVLYPDPRPLIQSLRRLRRPPVDAAAVADVAANLPLDYAAIEDYCRDYVQFQPAWTIYHQFWYFPTVYEVLEAHAGDCQGRALLASSILKAKDMPYTLRYSLDHVWVDYPGKQIAEMEDPRTSFFADSGKGWSALLPARLTLLDNTRVRIAYHWTPMPRSRKALLGLGALVALSVMSRH
jgi:hypothetical protein